MFSGIIGALGQVISLHSGARLSVDAGHMDLEGLRSGESISVNGTCLTVAGSSGSRLDFDISAETLACTTLGELRAGDKVNLERALRVGDRLGGHLVSGHVDGRGRILTIMPEGNSIRFEIEVAPELSQYLCRKGSVAVDGVSLTVNTVSGARFCVHIIPHTMEQTRFSCYRPGSSVNLEMDQMARYAERLLHPDRQ